MSNGATLALVMTTEIAAYFRSALVEIGGVNLCDSADDPLFWKASFALAVNPPAGLLARMPNLRCVIAPGAGVDHILADPLFPNHLPLARISQPDMLQRMKEYVFLQVLVAHRYSALYRAQQQERTWRPMWPQPQATDRVVGMMGLGSLGLPIAVALQDFGFTLRGWSRTRKSDAPFECFDGANGLEPFLASAEILVNMLPATPETTALLNAERFAQLPRGAALINAGRGATIDEAALLTALNNGQVRSATLDVFNQEPLPTDSALWMHPNVTITPHCASAVTPEALAIGVRAVIDAVLAGKPPPQQIDRQRGY